MKEFEDQIKSMDESIKDIAHHLKVMVKIQLFLITIGVLFWILSLGFANSY